MSVVNISMMQIPDELVSIIFSFFTIDDMKKYYFSFKPFEDSLKYVIEKYDFKEEARHLKIKIPGWYILHRKVRNKNLKQLVQIDNCYKTKKNNKKIVTYEYNYGLWSYHEGFCKIDNIIELNSEEKQLLKNKNFFKLPHEFYHSVPSNF